jgi:hypothetical protein
MVPTLSSTLKVIVSSGFTEEINLAFFILKIAQSKICANISIIKNPGNIGCVGKCAIKTG